MRNVIFESFGLLWGGDRRSIPNKEVLKSVTFCFRFSQEHFDYSLKLKNKNFFQIDMGSNPYIVIIPIAINAIVSKLSIVGTLWQIKNG